MVSVVIHTNTALANQVESAGWLKAGFSKHGIDAEITADKHKPADVHVIQGPWYAFNEWLGQPNVLWLDRCFYGDSRFDVSIGWLQPDGSRDFRNHGMAAGKGTLPVLAPSKGGPRRHAVIFADYGEINRARHWEVDARERFESVHFREHPADRKYRYFYTLDEIWSRNDTAIGGSSTVLVDAVINGLHVESHDPTYVTHGYEKNREAWLTDLSWAQWHFDEIENGDFWEHLH